jgi:hypothetical protein
MHTGESLIRLFEQLLRSKPLPLNGWDFVHVHCSHVACVTRGGMTPKLIPNREAGPGELRWTLRFDSNDTYPKRNRDAIRFGIRVLLRDHFDIEFRDIPCEALVELEQRLEELMLGDGIYVPFAEECNVTPLLALARALPSATPIRSVEYARDRSFERSGLAITELHRILSAKLRHQVFSDREEFELFSIERKR